MNEKPILMGAPMVRAILDGTKTQTRRCIGLESIEAGVPGDAVRCKYGVPGDRLWVKETHSLVIPHPVASDRAWWPGREPWPGIPADRPRHTIDTDRSIIYRADGEMPAGFAQQWKPSIFMRREYSRITLEIVDVRVERIQDISEEDARAEGLRCLSKDGGATWKWGIPDRDGYPGNDDDGWHWEKWQPTARDAFRILWGSINGDTGPKSWAANPWVWVIHFDTGAEGR